MNLEQLMRMSIAGTPANQKPPAGKGGVRGRRNLSTGHRGITINLNGSGQRRYQVMTCTTPGIYVGSTKTLEEALELQRTAKPEIPTPSKLKYEGVNWTGSSWRAAMTFRNQRYSRRGFRTQLEAAEWLAQLRDVIEEAVTRDDDWLAASEKWLESKQ